MDATLRRRMLRYYNERAPEYEDAYILGTGTASIPDPDVFVTEAKSLAGIVREFADGRLIDLACGTGYWLPFYAERCSHVTLFDQSEKMLAECRKKLDRLSLGDRSVVLQGDFFGTGSASPDMTAHSRGSFSVTLPNRKSRNCSTRSAPCLVHPGASSCSIQRGAMNVRGSTRRSSNRSDN